MLGTLSSYPDWLSCNPAPVVKQNDAVIYYFFRNIMMAVKDKSGDIAVLRTLGAKDGLIRAIFVWYGLLAGSVGSLFGVVIGVICALNLTSIINGIEYLIGHKFLSGDIYFIDFLPSELHWLDVFYVLVTALLLSLLASWYPARRASRIDPARVLSGQ